MDFCEVIKAVSAATGISMRTISRKMGKNDSYVGGMLTRNSDPLTANAATMLNKCGYMLCALPVDQVPEDALVISPRDQATPPRDVRRLERRANELGKQLDDITSELEQKRKI